MALTRRSFSTLVPTALLPAFAKAATLLVDTHIHLFDPKVFPYHAQATYQPPAEPLAPYVAQALQFGLSHAIIVHPEPYQDDHRYLEYCFRNEPHPGFFKGTCLFDATQKETPDRMADLQRRCPGRIVALRIHATEPTSRLDGPIRDRPLDHPQLAATWAAAGRLGLAIQMHMIPKHAPAVRRLMLANPKVPVVIDHLARMAQGTPTEFAEVLRLGELPNAYMKFSGLNYSSKQPPPHQDLGPAIVQIAKAFSLRRIIWGGLGMSVAQFSEQDRAFQHLFAFASPSEKAAVRGGNAARLYRLS